MSNERRRSSTATEFLEVVVRPKKYYKVKHPQDHSDRGKIVVSAGEKWRILKNVAVISLAMMTQYVAYQGTLNLQSSLNAKDGLGTIALSGIYLSMGISCLVLPTIMIRLVTCKWTLVIGMICFIPYIALQLYSRFLTLIPAGILLGVAAAPMWAAHATYLTQISQIYAIITESEMDAVITLFFGIFFFAWQNADTIGNLLSSLALQAPEEEPIGNNSQIDYSCCGHNYCSYHAQDIPQPLAKDILMLIMIYVPCVVIAILMVVFFLDPLTRYGEGRKGSHAKESTVMRNLLATVRQLKRTNQQMLIPLTIFIGLEQAWIAAEYTQSFVACALGVNMIGYVMITWGVMDSLFCFIFGISMQYIGRSMIIFIGASLNVVVIGFKLHYRPVPEHPVIFYALAGLWGISDAAWVTQIQAFYGLLFRRHKEAAFSNYRLFESIGFVLGFIYSSLLCVQSKLYIMLLVLTLGLIGFLAVEVLYQNKQGNYREQEKYATLSNDLRAARLNRDAEIAKSKADYYAKQIEEAPDRNSDGEDDELEQDVTVNVEKPKE